jgi:thiopeptide-type bacteriocin biosynthesis protein
VNIAYPGSDPGQRERLAIAHLTSILPAAEADGLITSWWFIRKGSWRVRYLPAAQSGGHEDDDHVHMLLTSGVTWTSDIYEPEIHSFGGPASMHLAHTLFHHDSCQLLSFLRGSPADRRERSLILCTTLMRAAGLDWSEQGDVWARIAEQRAGLLGQSADPGHQARASFTGSVRHLLRGMACVGAIGPDWLTAFASTGTALRTLREHGKLTRGLRAVITQHVIFHWNRIGLQGSTQAVLAKAAKEAVFGRPPLPPGTDA